MLLENEIKVKESSSPEAFRDEVLECLINESILVKGESYEEKYKSAETHLRKAFMEAGGNYMLPTFRKLLAVMKLLMANEYRAGKDSKKITGNFMKISNRIKSVCS
jgi:hypothetical protein